ncbi:hypothetical protein GCM10023193_51380 [Planotetraspora kaengkrachanensis]|uniref:Uncharacterized protein n=1 Tax=Planotetraspora kaengkrachanensis TaxID=575193 RepID=A0A8J3M5C7_9ACTN|nr:hypothetical protein Pka01_26670 [Planotetraspora kaengkrachanensis]
MTIKGTAGWADFERGGTVRILDTISEVGTTNEVNIVDLCLISGFPGAQPEETARVITAPTVYTTTYCADSSGIPARRGRWNDYGRLRGVGWLPVLGGHLWDGELIVGAGTDGWKIPSARRLDT